MEFVKGICPHCQGELQIPQGHQTIICMYCGKEFNVEGDTATAKTKSQPKPVDESEAIEALEQLLFGIEDPMQYFKKALYLDFYNKYVYENAGRLAMLEQFYLSSDRSKEMLMRIAEPLVNRVEEDVTALRGNKREQRQMDYNLAMVIYVFPALLETNEASGKAWIDALAGVWKEHFPKTELKAASSKEINAGFKYRFCYITTAVCECLHKPDDCYELTLLRSFRDEYLLQLQNGEEMVHEYYDVAPSIVKHIDKRADASEIYAEIYGQYLKPCIHMIEQGEHAQCAALYEQMVFDLKERYFYIAS